MFGELCYFPKYTAGLEVHGLAVGHAEFGFDVGLEVVVRLTLGVGRALEVALVVDVGQDAAEREEGFFGLVDQVLGFPSAALRGRSPTA